MLKIYLAGPILGLLDDEIHGWREHVKTELKDCNIMFLDPTLRTYNFDDDNAGKRLVESDKADVDECTLVIANCTIPSVGTSMEILYAWENYKPVLLVVPDIDVSPWLTYHVSAVFKNVDEVINTIRNFSKVWSNMEEVSNGTP
jgi:nucleoside 2-deoxyribosyltransferase